MQGPRNAMPTPVSSGARPARRAMDGPKGQGCKGSYHGKWLALAARPYCTTVWGVLGPQPGQRDPLPH
eukprot:5344272-Pyramimonas_sp.AAC.1